MKLLENWIKSLKIQNISITTIDSYKESTIMFLDYIKVEIIEIESSDILNFIAHRVDSGISKGTIIKNLSGIKSFFKYLYMNGKVPLNPTLDIKIKKDPRRLPTFHSVEIMNEVLDNSIPNNSKYSKNWIRDLALVEIAYSSGLRLAELHSLQISDINQTTNLVRVVGKGDKARVIPIGRKAIDALNKWLKVRSDIMEKNQSEQHLYVFTTTTGRRLSRTQINDRIKHLFKSNGITERSNTHILRHTFATHLINENVGIREIQEMLGHASLNTTQIYTFVDKNMLIREYLKSHPRALVLVKD